jgi:isopropylmalate/homocitrate/citramalate synthase
LRNYLAVVDAALEAGVTPRCHFEDVTRADIDGFVVPFAIALMQRAQESKRPIKIRLCDTMGVAVPWPAAALPRGVPKLVQTLRHEAGVPAAQLEWHGHNDLFKVHANSATAWLYGCSSVNTTLLSTGERTGNSPLEAAVVEYCGFTGETRLDLRVLTEIATYMREECDVPVPENYPLLGRDFNTTRAGIHIDGLLKDPEIYTLFDTQQLLNRPIGIAITDKSGVAGVAYWLNTHPEITGRRFTKGDAVVQAIYREIQQLYEDGRTTHLGDDELAAMARHHLATESPDA